MTRRNAGCEYRTSRGGCDNWPTQEVVYPLGSVPVKLCDQCLDYFLEAVKRINPQLKGVDIRPWG